jgi:hypothetical protein
METGIRSGRDQVAITGPEKIWSELLYRTPFSPDYSASSECPLDVFFSFFFCFETKRADAPCITEKKDLLMFEGSHRRAFTSALECDSVLVVPLLGAFKFQIMPNGCWVRVHSVDRFSHFFFYPSLA